MAAALAGALSRAPERPASTVTASHLPNPKFLALAARPVLNVVGTIYWLRLIHVSGDVRSSGESLFIYALGDLVTDLDRRFYLPYWYTALNVPININRRWHNSPLASKILEKGLGEFPDDTKLTLFLAQTELLYGGDKLKAGRLMRQVSNRPNVPAFIGPLATRILSHEGDFSAALEFAHHMEQTATDEEVRAQYHKRVQEIVLEARLTEVDKASKAYRDREGRIAGSIEALVVSGDLREAPTDPFGGTIFLGDDGNARSTSAGKRLRLNDDPRDPIYFEP